MWGAGHMPSSGAVGPAAAPTQPQAGQQVATLGTGALLPPQQGLGDAGWGAAPPFGGQQPGFGTPPTALASGMPSLQQQMQKWEAEERERREREEQERKRRELQQQQEQQQKAQAQAVALAQEAKRRGATRVRTHAGGYEPETIRELVSLGAYCEFSFFVLTHATQVGLTHVDQEKHRAPGKTVQDLTPRISAAGDRAIVSGDAGIYLLPPPVEAFREFLLLLESEGFSEGELRMMSAANPIALFRIGSFPS